MKYILQAYLKPFIWKLWACGTIPSWAGHWNSTNKHRSGKSLPYFGHATLTEGLSNQYLAVTQKEHSIQLQIACLFVFFFSKLKASQLCSQKHCNWSAVIKFRPNRQPLFFKVIPNVKGIYRGNPTPVSSWRIPSTEKLRRQQAMGSQRVRHNRSGSAHIHAIQSRITSWPSGEGKCNIIYGELSWLFYPL